MMMPRKLALTVGLTIAIGLSVPANAQFGEADLDTEQLQGIDEVLVTDPGLLALQPDGSGQVEISAPVLGERRAQGFGGGMSRCPTGGMNPYAMGASGFCPPGGAGPSRSGGPFAFLQGDHALSDEQYEKLFQLKNDFLDKAGPKLAQLKVTERDMLDLMTQPQMDKAKVKDLQSKINNEKAELANMRIDHRMSTLEVLTAAQRKELRSHIVQGSSWGMGQCKRHRGNTHMRG